MQDDSIESRLDAATRAIARDRFEDISGSKYSALLWLKNGDAELRQACISVLTTKYPLDSETIAALSHAQLDENAIVRSTARLHLASHYRSVGDKSWSKLMIDDICDEQLDAAARISTYVELIRLVGQTLKFADLCERLGILTIADIDWQLIEEMKVD
jgi:hypothetical protein